MAPKAKLVDPVLGPLSDDLLTPDVRVFQRLQGHRFSSDDVATAFVAWQEKPDARRIIDLGCGLGSVLLLLAWKLPSARLVGVEAQDESFALLERNVSRNGLSDRVTIQHGDLRDESLASTCGSGFDLVTGTPPYFPPNASVDARDAQRAYARIEYRGGVEAYLEAGARLLAEEGAMVLCGDARADERVVRGAAACGLSLNARCDVIARAGRPPLFSVWTLSRHGRPVRMSSMTLRDSEGRQTRDADAMRTFSGFTSLFPD
jgi:tRNA1(Val) A37 N6-methylase TrmN6